MPAILQKSAQIVKVDEAMGLVFGFAIVCKENGQDYFDVQDDHIPEDAMLKAADDFMTHSRVSGEMHQRPDGKVVFAFPLTTEVAKALGIETQRTGLLVAIRPSKAVFDKFKSGEYTGFSIGGERGTDEIVKAVDTGDEISNSDGTLKKYNDSEARDASGRWTDSGGGGAGGSGGSSTPSGGGFKPNTEYAGPRNGDAAHEAHHRANAEHAFDRGRKGLEPQGGSYDHGAHTMGQQWQAAYGDQSAGSHSDVMREKAMTLRAKASAAREAYNASPHAAAYGQGDRSPENLTARRSAVDAGRQASFATNRLNDKMQADTKPSSGGSSDQADYKATMSRIGPGKWMDEHPGRPGKR